MASSDQSSFSSGGASPPLGGGPAADFSEDEEDLIARMYTLIGQRWTLIAGRIPGRTAEEIEKYWTVKSSSSSD
ncbi:unnamed protein product [Spirodela intermedia]|uniref:Uncharacterized protein n=1 Tax=Spirodela intermedia TaxID=51605 RepID=A0A7I8JR69_SPIIN|nr:unnamed protein product [Spirodela intermedia]CAA6671932.1 unnamed protein product [Spirodela intermedia]